MTMKVMLYIYMKGFVNTVHLEILFKLEPSVVAHIYKF